jgi:hypothetical protein
VTTETDLFEAFVARYTGRDMDYHKRYKTRGIEFARIAWDESAKLKRMTAVQHTSNCDYDTLKLGDRVTFKSSAAMYTDVTEKWKMEVIGLWSNLAWVSILMPNGNVANSTYYTDDLELLA